MHNTIVGARRQALTRLLKNSTWCHCEERSDAAIWRKQAVSVASDCFAALAMTSHASCSAAC